MAQQNDTVHETHQTGQTRQRGRSGLYFVTAVVLLAVAGGALYIGLAEEPVEGQLYESPVEDARPVGAGTFPDGQADEFQEGLMNETDQSDFIAPSAPTDAPGDTLIEVPESDAPTVTSIDDLEPDPAVNEELLDRMAPSNN